MTTELLGTREIPRTEWVAWLDAFSREHRGWLVTVELVAANLGDQEEVRRRPLVGVSADVKDGENRVLVAVGGPAGGPAGHTTHVIERPRRVWLKGRDAPDVPGREALSIEDESGTMTLVRFEHVDADLQLALSEPSRT